MRFYRQLQRCVYVMRLLKPFAVIKTIRVALESNFENGAAKLPAAPTHLALSTIFYAIWQCISIIRTCRPESRASGPIELFVSAA